MERTGKEVDTAQFEVLSLNLLQGTEKMHEYIIQDSWSLGWV